MGDIFGIIKGLVSPDALTFVLQQAFVAAFILLFISLLISYITKSKSSLFGLNNIIKNKTQELELISKEVAILKGEKEGLYIQLRLINSKG